MVGTIRVYGTARLHTKVVNKTTLLFTLRGAGTEFIFYLQLLRTLQYLLFVDSVMGKR